jgi:aryl-alcohol dehydrogenase-like predicted oxidoreductase
MGIETIDLYYTHADDRQSPMEERLRAFDDLIRSGKVRYIGASNHLDWRIEEAHCLSLQNGWPEFCCVQQRYSYVRPQAGSIYDPHVVVNDEFLDYCRNRGLTILAYSPLLGGAFVRSDRALPEQYIGPDTGARLKVLKEVAEETDATPNQVVLAWFIQSDPTVIPLVAASKPEHLAENLGSLELELSEDQLVRLSKAGNRPALHPNHQRRLPPGAKEG